MPRSTPEAIREYNQMYYAKNRERLIKELNERYHTDDEFYNKHRQASAKWYRTNHIREKRLITRKLSQGIKMEDIDLSEPIKKPPKKPKSSLQLKRERIAKNLAKIEQRAEAFRQKLSQEKLYNAPQIENEPATDNSRSD